eukprot:29565-Pelagococcus_subviridis.AAC.3
MTTYRMDREMGALLPSLRRVRVPSSLSSAAGRTARRTSPSRVARPAPSAPPRPPPTVSKSYSPWTTSWSCSSGTRPCTSRTSKSSTRRRQPCSCSRRRSPPTLALNWTRRTRARSRR